MWGIAFLAFSCLTCFRDWISTTMAGAPKDLILLLLSLILIAAGNGFAHWQYNPSAVFEVIASLMAIGGIAGLSLFEKRFAERGYKLFHVDRGVF